MAPGHPAVIQTRGAISVEWGRLFCVLAWDRLMTKSEIKQAFQNVSTWQRRAPHKPLLLLFALARCARGEGRMIPYGDVDETLRPLLIEFGPPRKSQHPEYPFWYLQTDAVWTVENAEEAKVRSGKRSQPTKLELLRVGAAGGFTPQVQRMLASDSRLRAELAQRLLDGHFPETLHRDILDAIGLDLDEFGTEEKTKRDPRFREQVLLAYGYQCALCGFDLQLGRDVIGIEAAHIKWHMASGPSTTNNGLALCSLHHKLFDRGAFTLDTDRRILLSKHARGGTSTRRWLTKVSGKRLHLPDDPGDRPKDSYVAWHQRQVFREPAVWRGAP